MATSPLYLTEQQAWVLASYEHCFWALNNPAICPLYPSVPDLSFIDELQRQAHHLIETLSMVRQTDFVTDFALPLVNYWTLGADALSNSLLSLLSYPKQQALLLSNISLLPTAIDELLRFSSPLPFIRAQLDESVSYAGVHIPAGATLLLNLASANRDPAVYTNADVLDILRPKTSAQLAFAQPIPLKTALQMILSTGLTAVLTHWSDLRLAQPLTVIRSSGVLDAPRLLSLPLLLPEKLATYSL